MNIYFDDIANAALTLVCSIAPPMMLLVVLASVF